MITISSSVKRLFRGRTVVATAAVVLVLVVAVEAAILMREAGPSRPVDGLDALWSGHYEEDRKKWKEAIEEVGTRQAYTAFVEDTSKRDFGVAHTLAHIMGELVYEREGIEGIAVCDGSFGFGCYHSFFGKAISEHGIDVVDELDRACVKQWGPIGLGCPHGIGHGIQGYFGDEGLLESLDICERLSWKGSIGGCSSGVFMEFNFHTMESLRGAESRSFDPAKPLYPCNAVGGRFSQSCYYELPAWLLGVKEGSFKAVGEVCALAPEGPERAACYKGAGAIAAESSGYDVARAVASCSLMPDRDAEILCRAGAAWGLFAEPSKRDRAEEPCDGLPAKDRAFCIEQSKIIQYSGPEPRA